MDLTKAKLTPKKAVVPNPTPSKSTPHPALITRLSPHLLDLRSNPSVLSFSKLSGSDTSIGPTAASPTVKNTLSNYRDLVVQKGLLSQLGQDGLTRAQFISVLGVAAVSVVGAAGIVKQLIKMEGKPPTEGGVGPRGPQGEQGNEGQPGKEGSSGSHGNQGIQGSRGETGATGPAGQNGDDNAGVSSSQLATHEADTTNIHGINNTADLMLLSALQVVSALKVFSLPSGNDTALATQITNDSVPRLAFKASGNLEWGSGSTVADTNLYRSAADTLKTDATFIATQVFEGANRVATQSGLDAHSADTTNVHGIADTSQLATGSEVASAVSSHSLDTTNVHGITDTSVLATDSDVSTAVSSHSSNTSNVHGIANTANLETMAGAQAKVDTHSADTTAVHGIADTSTLESTTGSQAKVDLHSADTTNVHGIANTANLETTTGAQTKVDTHVNDTTAAHTASAIAVSPTVGGADDVQEALTTLNAKSQGELAYAERTTSFTATTTTGEPVPGMSITFTTDGRPLLLELSVNIAKQTADGTIDLYVENPAGTVTYLYAPLQMKLNTFFPISPRRRFTLTAGTYTMRVGMARSTATAVISVPIPEVPAFIRVSYAGAG